MKTKLRPGWVLALLCTVLFFKGCGLFWRF